MAGADLQIDPQAPYDGNGHALDVALPIVDPQPPANPWLSAQRIMLIFTGLAIVLWLLNGFYQVGVGEVAVVERLGQFVNGPDHKPMIAKTGLRYQLPWPIDRIFIVPVDRTQTLQITSFNRSPKKYASFEKTLLRKGEPKRVIDAIYKPYLITADQNVLHCQIMLQFRVRNPVHYLISVYENPSQRQGQGRTAMIDQLAAHELIRKVAATPVDAALFYGRQKLEEQLFDDLKNPKGGTQRPMHRLRLGIKVQNVQIEDMRWPKAENAAFLSVVDAQQQQNTAVQNAYKYAVRKKTVAAGQAQAILNAASAYRDRVVEHATGEASQFAHVYGQYKLHPRIVRLALFADTLETVMDNVNRVFYVEPHQKISLVLKPPPLLIHPRNSQSANQGRPPGGPTP